MKKLVLIWLTALAAAAVTLGVAPAASAYPDLTCNLTVNHQTVVAGKTFTVTGTAADIEKAARAAATGDDISWVMKFNGDTRTGTGTTFVQKFKAPVVSKPTVLPLVARATSTAGTCQHTLNLTILPTGVVTPPGSGTLPNTGGPRLILLIGGLVLVLAGGGAVWGSRKGRNKGHTA
ncbi:MAG: hypothetical protein JWP74_147 [Marmoricola sp.]|nr:hypothetical protein [Marmoricola sp.]